MTPAAAPSHSDAPVAAGNRRRATRFDVAVPLVVTNDQELVPTTIRNLSSGGFLLESAVPFRVDAFHLFRVLTPEGQWRTVLTAEVAHMRKETKADGSIVYFVGFVFVQPTSAQAMYRVREMVNRPLSVLAVTGGEA